VRSDRFPPVAAEQDGEGAARAMILAPALLIPLLLVAPPAARGAAPPDVKERRTIHLLIKDLADAKHEVRAEAERKLKQIGPRAVADLILVVDGRHVMVTTMLPDKRRAARARAVRVLGAIGGEPAERRLIRALGDPTELVKRAAIGALGAMRCNAAAKELVKLLSDEKAVIVNDVLLALGAIGDRSAVQPILGILTDPQTLKGKYEDAAHVSQMRGSAAFALGMIGDPAAVPALLGALRDDDVRVRRLADLALRKMSGHSVGFDAKAPAAKRNRAAKAWDVFWKRKQEKK